MKRRNFIKNTAAFGLPLFVKGMPVQALPYFGALGVGEEEKNRVLVLIQLIGGNDGLNTVIPMDQYDKLMQFRGDIMIPQKDLLEVDTNMGFHPAMGGLLSIYKEGQLGIIQDVGYPNPNRSHFRSTDIWTSASSSEEVIATGWLGRFFEDQAPGFPEAYPNGMHTDPFAISVGKTISTTCQGLVSNFSMAMEDPFSLSQIAAGEGGTLPDSYYGNQLSFLRTAINQSNAYSSVITEAADRGQNLSNLYPESGKNPLADQLKSVALLISGGLKTQIYVVQLGGFDTHSNQVEDGQPLAGRHTILLERLSEAVAAFQDDLNKQNLEKQVLGMTFSEFGRRIRSNGSFGTDHGTAAPLFLFGNCVQPGTLGKSPNIPDDPGIKDGVEMQYDFRNVYGTLLKDWLGVEETKIKEILFPEFSALPILTNCLATDVSNLNNQLQNSLEIFPNPVRNNLKVRFLLKDAGESHFSILDLNGRTLKRYKSVMAFPGENIQQVDVKGLSSGSYILKVEVGKYSGTRRFIKI